MHVYLSRKEMALLICLLDTANSHSDYWSSLEEMPDIMKSQGINNGDKANVLADHIQKKLKIWIEQ